MANDLVERVEMLIGRAIKQHPSKGGDYVLTWQQGEAAVRMALSEAIGSETEGQQIRRKMMGKEKLEQQSARVADVRNAPQATAYEHILAEAILEILRSLSVDEPCKGLCSFCDAAVTSMRSGESDIFDTCDKCAEAWDRDPEFVGNDVPQLTAEEEDRLVEEINGRVNLHLTTADHGGKVGLRIEPAKPVVLEDDLGIYSGGKVDVGESELAAIVARAIGAAQQDTPRGNARPSGYALSMRLSWDERLRAARAAITAFRQHSAGGMDSE